MTLSGSLLAVATLAIVGAVSLYAIKAVKTAYSEATKLLAARSLAEYAHAEAALTKKREPEQPPQEIDHEAAEQEREDMLAMQAADDDGLI